MSAINNNGDALNLVCWYKEKKCCSLVNNSGVQQELFACAAAGCDRMVHPNCSTLMLQAKDANPDDRPDHNDKIYFCMKSHFNKWLGDKIRAQKAAAKAEKAAAKAAQKKKKTWDPDGTLKALLQWWTTEPNCENYCGANKKKGTSKDQYNKEIADFITKQCPDNPIAAEQVSNKIFTLETSWKKGHDWINQTGQGVLKREGPQAVEEHVKKHCCSLHYELEEIMAPRPNAEPLATNYTDVDGADDEGVFSGGDDGLDLSSGGSDSEEEEAIPVEEDQEPKPLEEMTAEETAAKLGPLATTIEIAPTPSPMPNNTAVSTPANSGSTVSTVSTVATAAATTASATATKTPSASSSKKKRRLIAKKDANNRRNAGPKAEDTVNSLFPDPSQCQSIQERTVVAKEQEAAARKNESVACVEKTRLESETLRMKNNALALENRAKHKGNMSKEELDLLFPLEYPKKK